ncbi:MAG: helix-hairpin-helix domain-containing protein [Firmicutes bacterium]|nr:helix-hairpin-helix domain-containing protein [Bacillota bacterium]
MKILKRYYIFIFIFALVIGLIIRDISTSKFAVIKTSQAYAPDTVNVIEEADTDGEKVNINTASKRILMTLDGIGEKMSERIIEYREKNGRFETIEDIMRISGIGYDTFLKLKDYITVE